jgi:hypothetical protein
MKAASQLFAKNPHKWENNKYPQRNPQKYVGVKVQKFTAKNQNLILIVRSTVG